ncbi:MAG: hypothetical protein FWG84_03160 [Bacteroidales bacterium]|nr:hypothetical protein [Bacteroidales bacterium]
MTKRRLNLRNVVAIAICLAGFLTITALSGCKKEKESTNPSNPDVPPLINVEKGLSYSEVLENLTANGYVPSEKTDSTIVFKGADLDGIHPLADFLTDYVIHSSKQVTFAFDEDGLYMLHMEGKTEADAIPYKLKMQSVDDFMEDAKGFVRDQYESLYVSGISRMNCGAIHAKQFTCGMSHVIGAWDILRLSFDAGNIYPSYWWYATPGYLDGGLDLYFLLIPNNKPGVEPEETLILDFECRIYWAAVQRVIGVNNYPCWH